MGRSDDLSELTAPQLPVREPIPDQDSDESAEAVFLTFLAQREEPEAEGFETVCSKHPQLESELRELHANFERIQGVVGKQRKVESLQATLVSVFGKSVDPEISLEAVQSPSDSIVERLEGHSSTVFRYEIEDEIARGGMGVIRKAWDHDLRRTLAMKSLIGDDSSALAKPDELKLRRFLEEAQITGQLGHPGIVPVHELGIDHEGRVYFTMPLVRGREFKRIISLVRDGEEGWTLPRALRALHKVCEAVAYAHAKGVIHRDLKPANIMIGRFGETYVMDWGLARVLDRPDGRDLRLRDEAEPQVETDRSSHVSEDVTPLMTMDGAVIGTPAYMPPEQAAGRIEQLDERSDVYALGAMLYHLLTYQMPYVARGQYASPRTVLHARLNGPPVEVAKLRPEVPTVLVDICEKAMATSPDDRYPTALGLAEDIEAYLNDRPVSAREATLGYQLSLAFKRHRGAVLTAMISLVILIAATGIFVRNQQQAIRARTRALDIVSARALPLQADDLYPALPSAIPALRGWLERADDLSSREELWRRELREADLDSRAEVDSIIAGLGKLPALRESVAERLALARALEDPAHLGRRESWARAIEAIRESPSYSGLELEEIPGLIPLGEDFESRLWEFWSPLSGERSSRDSATGKLTPAPEDGLVLVLLPGGPFEMGQPGSQTTVTLAPFLMGKYEVTQAQWERVMGGNPTLFEQGVEWPRSVFSDDVETISPIAPVTNMNWFSAAEFAQRCSLELPTDAQWEYACRAGTTATYYWGESPEDLEMVANVGTGNCPETLRNDAPPWDDGFCYLSPIGSFPANAMGLHDMLGNVSEWCSNWYLEDSAGGEKRRHFRGGNFILPPSYCYADWRQFEVPFGGNQARGLRVSRPIR